MDRCDQQAPLTMLDDGSSSAQGMFRPMRQWNDPERWASLQRPARDHGAAQVATAGPDDSIPLRPALQRQSLVHELAQLVNRGLFGNLLQNDNLRLQRSQDSREWLGLFEDSPHPGIPAHKADFGRPIARQRIAGLIRRLHGRSRRQLVAERLGLINQHIVQIGEDQFDAETIVIEEPCRVWKDDAAINAYFKAAASMGWGVNQPDVIRIERRY